MEQLGIERLEIDPHIEEKLWAKHERVTFREVEQALMDDEAIVVVAGEGIFDVYGRTFDGLPMLVVLAVKGEGSYKVVTARPMNRREARWFENERGR